MGKIYLKATKMLSYIASVLSGVLMADGLTGKELPSDNLNLMIGCLGLGGAIVVRWLAEVTWWKSL